MQYYSPWFRHLASRAELELKVFYLWDFGVKESTDQTFQTSFVWDIPLLDGYAYEFITNHSHDPGTHHFRGLENPQAVETVAAWQPDAVLLFGYNYRTHLRLIFSRRLAKIPFYFRGDSHELCLAAGWKSHISRLLRGLIFRRFKGFFAVGQANAGYFRNCGIKSDKIHYVPHCVDNDRFQAVAIQAKIDATAWKQNMGIPLDSTVILFAGKFEEKKRPLDLLEAFLGMNQNTEDGTKNSFSSLPNINHHQSLPPILLFVGSGPLETTLREAAGSELGRSVFIAPFQNQSRMPMVYAAGDLIALPSMGRGETWGLVINEAFNLGIPAIVSSHVGCGPDLILQSETGWIFPAGDAESLKQTLIEALSDPERLKQFGDRARNRISNYSYDHASQALCEALDRV